MTGITYREHLTLRMVKAAEANPEQADIIVSNLWTEAALNYGTVIADAIKADALDQLKQE